MQILIANQSAVLKKGTSFDFVSENRLFSGSDSYSMTITFPLKDCAQNLAIFGHINRADVALGKAIFDCEIRDKGFYKFGSITITEINDTEVKTQFLEGRSEQNFDKTFDKVYINEMELGSGPTTSLASVDPVNSLFPPAHGHTCVPLPWVNDASGNIQNLRKWVEATKDVQAHYEWDTDNCRGLSWQPYLLYITQQICKQIGYSYDFSVWEEMEEYKYLLICNTLPFAWYMTDFSHALPHWTVEEYFEKLELFMGCEFAFDHRSKHIGFKLTRQELRSKPLVHLTDIVDDHSTEVKMADDDARCDYLGAKRLAYKDCDHDTWKYYSCDWYVNGLRESQIIRFDTMTNLLKSAGYMATWDGQYHRNQDRDKVLYAADADAYFIPRAMRRSGYAIHRDGHWECHFTYHCRLQPINQFGASNPDEDADTVELDLVPVRVEYTEYKYGDVMFLAFQGMDDGNEDNVTNENDLIFRQLRTVETLKAGEKDKKAEYYDRLYIGFWDGAQYLTGGKLPHPEVYQVRIEDDWSNFNYNHFDMRLNNKHSSLHSYLPKIEPRLKTTFKFLIGETDSLPDPRSLFLIRGKRYVCEKLTATFTEHGMSRQVKGIFYPVQEN